MRKLLPIAFLVALCVPAFATNPPIIFFTDIADGPNSGNSDTTFSATGGAYVTIYGNFLDSFSSIKLNNSACLTVVSNPTAWNWYEKMVVKIGTTCTSGNFSITTAGGTWTGPTVDNALTGVSTDFTVRSGSIFYISTTGTDTGGSPACATGGTFSAPWATIACATQSHQPNNGEIYYAENGVTTGSSCPDSGGWGSWSIRVEWSSVPVSGFASALLAYPGATATIGITSCSGQPGIRSTDGTASGGAAKGWWTVGGFVLRNASDVVDLNGATTYPAGGSEHWRFIGNDASCPNGTGSDGCFHTLNIGNTAYTNHFLGNHMHDAGNGALGPGGNPDDQYHGEYYSDQTKWTDVGWELIERVVGCNGIQSYSNTNNQFSILFHDLTIHDTTCAGILGSTYNPSRGGIFYWNIVEYAVGKGPQQATGPEAGGGAFNGIRADQGQNGTDVGSGNIVAFNNSIYNPTGVTNYIFPCGGAAISGLGLTAVAEAGLNTNDGLTIINNAVQMVNTSSPCTGGMAYYGNDSGTATLLTGTKNLFYATFGCGTGSPGPFPCSDTHVTSSVTSNPGFVSTTDLHLSSAGSPANGAGTLTGLSGVVPSAALLYDHDGVIRPNPPSIGALEFAGAAPPPSSTTAPASFFFADNIQPFIRWHHFLGSK